MRPGTLSACLSGAVWLAAATVDASPPQTQVTAESSKATWAPTLGVELGYSPERLKVDFPTASYREDRELWNSRIAVGLDGRWSKLLWGLDGRSVSEVGYGFVHHTGHGLFELTESALLEFALGRHFALPFGAALVGSLDTSSSARSSLALGLPIGFRFRAVEIWYRPSFVLPLGSEDEPVFTGARRLSARPGLNWLDFGLRVRFGFLEF